MKKYLIGFIVGAVMFVPATVIAGNSLPSPNKIYQYSNGNISVFDDQDNKCYVARGGYGVAISCIKE